MEQISSIDNRSIDNKHSTDTAILSSCIMLVDDEPTNLKLLQKTLAAEGYENVLAVQDPCDVLGLYQTNEIDLILLDLNMPKMDGYQVMEQLKQANGGDMPTILVLTAQRNQDFRLRAFNMGARDYVTKPFDRPELLARVRNLLELHQAQQSLFNQNVLLEQKVQERTQEIRDTRLQIIRRLGRATEYRDNETGFHIMRMSQISALLSDAYGLPATETELVLNASPMHDIGKIGIPDGILLKPAKFEPYEWEIMKTHTTIGADILSGDDSDLLEMARIIALTHHEKWDGTGYPQRLKGEAIPLVGRIVALADVFDALTANRPYKLAWSIDNAIQYFEENRGYHFDPDLVDCFVDNLDVVLSIKESYMEPNEMLASKI